jgi:hypothetical protein
MVLLPIDEPEKDTRKPRRPFLTNLFLSLFPKSSISMDWLSNASRKILESYYEY